MIPINHPFGFAQGRLFSQSARKGWGTRQKTSVFPMAESVGLDWDVHALQQTVIARVRS